MNIIYFLMEIKQWCKVIIYVHILPFVKKKNKFAWMISLIKNFKKLKIYLERNLKKIILEIFYIT